MNYEKAYAELKEFIIKLRPYCDTCAFAENEKGCDECHRRNINWKMDKSLIERIEEIAD